LLGRGSRFDGKLHFEGRVRIDGTFSGEIVSDDTLVIGEGAVVDGDILAGSVIIRGGRIRADVRATRAIELYVPAEVNGNLMAPEVFIDKGVQFTGTCTIGAVNADQVHTDDMTESSGSQGDAPNRFRRREQHRT
jgi:cytoskeletal protein CcmA (bactofilin family)